MSAAQTSLAVSVVDSYTLDSFVITGVDVVPSTSARLYVLITASTGRVFARTVALEGDAYTAWQSDSYLYEFVQSYLAANFTP